MELNQKELILLKELFCLEEALCKKARLYEKTFTDLALQTEFKKIADKSGNRYENLLTEIERC